MVAKTKVKRGTSQIVATEEQMLVAQRSAETKVTNQDAYGLLGEARSNAEDRMTVEHRTAEKVWMYKPTLDKDRRPIAGAWRPVEVPVTAIEMNVKNGFKARCPDCHDPRKPDSGIHGNGFNDCPGRVPLAYRTCPVCAKKVPDFPSWEATNVDSEGDDPNEIKENLLSTLTPAQRTKTLLEQHLLAYHPSRAEALGLRPQPRVTATWAAPGEDR